MGKKGRETSLCLACLYWDQRPEEGQVGYSGYCRQKENIVGLTKKCEYYRKRTPKRQESLYRELYGEMEDEEMEEEEE
jgi:hypothetical protein